MACISKAFLGGIGIDSVALGKGLVFVIRFLAEKKGGCPVNRRMQMFDAFVQRRGLRDSPLFAAKYTWSKNQENLVMYRLDRFLTSPD